MSKTDLAHVFGVEPAMIDMWLCKGLPYIRRPRPRNGQPANERDWLFDTADAIEWRVSTLRMDYNW